MCLLIFRISEEGIIGGSLFHTDANVTMDTKSSFPQAGHGEGQLQLKSRPTGGRRASSSTLLGPQSQQFPFCILGFLFLFTFYLFMVGRETWALLRSETGERSVLPEFRENPFKHKVSVPLPLFPRSDLSISSNSTFWHETKGNSSALTLGLKGK